jgi:hypothetical protein
MEKTTLKSITQIVNDVICEELEIFKERDSQYGESYNKVGSIMQILFPNGISIYTKEQHQQFDLLKQVVGKLSRFSHKFPQETHRDSLIDAANYTNLLIGVIEQKQLIDKYLKNINITTQESTENS